MATMKTATASGGSAMAETADEMRTELAQLDTRVRAFVNERPIMALLSAVAAGYLAGRVLGRRG